MGTIYLEARSQSLGRNARGFTEWQSHTDELQIPAQRTALVICDMWDRNWSRAANARVAELAPRVDAFARELRQAGSTIIHAPSETMDFYADHPARSRALGVPARPLPPLGEHDDPPLPIDHSDGGSDSNDGSEPVHTRTWSRQTEAIEIDPEGDYISDSGDEIYAIMGAGKIDYLLLCGVHTNMCILNRSFGIRNLVPRGVSMMLLRELTDALYNPAMPPYVSHEEGTALVVGYIEKFWCPTAANVRVSAGERPLRAGAEPSNRA